MEDLVLESHSSAPSRGKRAEDLLEELFSGAGWRVRRNVRRNGSSRLDMVVRRGKASYAVEGKASAEGRGDRLIPLWSQACLQAAHAAGEHNPPLAVVAAPK